MAESGLRRRDNPTLACRSGKPWPAHLFRSITPELIRSNCGGAVGAAGIAIYLTAPSLYGPWLPLGIGMLWASVWCLERCRPDKLQISLIVLIVGSAWVAVPVSALSGGQAPQTLWLALLTTVLVPLAWSRDCKPIFCWLIPVWILHSLVSLAQWLDGVVRVTGIAANANAGAAFILLGCIYLINGHRRSRWLVLPLIAAMPFTGSRWSIVVIGATFLTIFACRLVPWRYVALGIGITLAITLAVGWHDIYAALNRPSTLGIHLMGYGQTASTLSLWVPRGFYDSGIHVVPLRMMHETGIISGLAWIVATLYALSRRPLFNGTWWMLLSVALLSLMYYHTWIGPLAPFWWLLTGASSPNRYQS